MNKINRLRAYVDTRATGDEPDAPIVFVASTEGKKADGADLRMEDWTLDRFLQHPVILYAHDYMGHNLPIGTGEPYFEERNLMMRVRFDSEEDEFADRVRRKTLKGMMGGSVGWSDRKDGGGKVRHELLEFSIVPVPLDAAALPVYGARAMELATEYAKLTEETTDETQSEAEAQWREASAAMVDLFTRCADDADDGERQKRYNALLPKYRRAGKTPPEFLPAKHVAALSPDELRGLFLAGEEAAMPELDTRAGQVLSSRNRGDLEQAMTLIQGVLDRAKIEKAENTGEESQDQPALDAGRPGETERSADADLQALLEKLNKIG
jgi:hypothetical protein